MSLLPRPIVTVPDGRTFQGIWPQNLPATGEGPFIWLACRQFHGVPEVTLPAGRCDFATNADARIAHAACEVEPASSWRKGAQQAYAYGGMTGMTPVLLLIGPGDYEAIREKVRRRMSGLTVYRYVQGSYRLLSGPVARLGNRCHGVDLALERARLLQQRAAESHAE